MLERPILCMLSTTLLFYFFIQCPQSCRHDEEKRLEEVRMRVRNRRQEEVEEKKGRQVIVTDRLPPAKRSKCTSWINMLALIESWLTYLLVNPAPTRPKTLFEKTRAESLKLQRLVYGRPTSTKSTTPSKVSAPSKASTPSKPTGLANPKSLLPIRKSTAIRVDTSESEKAQQILPPSPPKPTGLSVPVGSVSPQKDLMSTLFMPKHRAHSQLPGSPSVTTRRNWKKDFFMYRAWFSPGQLPRSNPSKSLPRFLHISSPCIVIL